MIFTFYKIHIRLELLSKVCYFRKIKNYVMKKIYSTTLLLIAASYGFSQSNTVASGGDASGSGGSLSYSIGQIDYTSQTGTSGNSNQGVQQPFEFYKNTSSVKEMNSVEMNLYPNPTNEFVILKISTLSENFTYNLYDMVGRVIASGEIISAETQIDARNYAPGEYHLTISQQNNQIESFKIIKNQ